MTIPTNEVRTPVFRFTTVRSPKRPTESRLSMGFARMDNATRTASDLHTQLASIRSDVNLTTNRTIQ